MSPAAAAGLVGIAAWSETDDPYAPVAALLAGEDGSARLLFDPGLPSRQELFVVSG